MTQRHIARALFIGVVLGLLGVPGCVKPAPMGLTRVQVCLNAETGQRYDGPPRTARGASVCADFEGAQ